MKLFSKIDQYTKEGGVIVTKFFPSVDIYISSINCETGTVSENKVVEYSKHENLRMYKISSKKNQFKDFWVSSDHSLVIYDSYYDHVRKSKPTELTQSCFLIKKLKSNIILSRTDSIMNYLLNQGLILIPFSNIDIEYDSDKTVAYDFTVENDFTFCNDDGIFLQDTMALYVPITKEAMEEAKDKMSGSLSKDGMGQLADSFDKDTAVGIYVLTKNPTKRTVGKIINVKRLDDIESLDIYTEVKYSGIKTTVGRVLFNSILPKNMKYINDEIDLKKLNNLAKHIHEKYPIDVYIDFADKTCRLSYKYSTLSGVSFTLDDITVPSSIKSLKEKINGSSIEQVQKLLNESEVRLKKYSESNNTNLGLLGKAGTLKGGYGQARQVVVAKGLATDNEGNILKPISDSYAEGINNKDFFRSGAGSRSGIADRVLNTSETGYLMRQLVFALQRVEADPSIFDCGTKRYFRVKANSDIAKRLTGRNIVNNRGKIIKFNPTLHTDKVIQLRSPLYCLSPKICSTCYGDLLTRNRTQYVGMLVAQILGELGTQTIMRTFHSGGAVEVKILNVIDSITEQLDQAVTKYVHDNFYQKNRDFFSKLDCTINIIKSEYLDIKSDIKKDGNNLILKYGYFDIITASNVTIPCAIDNEIIINLDGKEYFDSNESIRIKCPSTSPLFTVSLTTDSFRGKVKDIKQLFNGKKPRRSSDHFCLKIYDQYKDLTKCDMVHFEVIASQLLRDRGNPSYPARLNANYNAVIHNLKDIPKLESWLAALAFENFSEAVTTGLVYNRDTKDSILEQVVSGIL